MRFKEYTDNYVLTKLIDRCEIITRSNDKICEYPVMMISAGNGFIFQSEKYSRDNAGSSLHKYVLLHKGELAYNRGNSKQFPYGAIYEMLEEKALIPYVYHCFKMNRDESTRYYSYYLNSSFKNVQLSKIITSSVRGNGLLNISKNDFFNLKIQIPSLSEQKKIAAFLDLIEDRIQTQIKIIDDYTCLKKYIIHQIFSCNNQKVKLINLIKDSTRRNKDNSIKRILSVNNKLGFLKQSEQFEDRTIASSDVSNYKIVYMNQYAYNPARINVGSIARLINYENGIVSPMYIIFNINSNKINHTYFDAFLESICFKNQLRKKLEGSVRQCLTFESLKSMYIPLPEINVQIKYAKTLNELESKIILEKQILEKYQSQKMYLLNNMFI